MNLQRTFTTLILTGVLCCTPVLITAQNDTPAPQEETGLSIHVVQRGENLFRISLLYGTSVEELATLNGILDVNSLEIGQRLLVPVAGPTPEIRTYTVQAGDTPGAIAGQFGITLDELLKLNELTTDSAIYAGQILQIPTEIIQASEPVSPPENPENTQQETGQSVFLHTVEANETLFRIALKYNVSLQDITVANNLSDPTLIYVGQRLIIPNMALPEAITENLPAPFSSIRINPVVFVEGETGVIEVNTSEATTLSGTFLEKSINFLPVENGTRHYALIAVPVFTSPETYTITVTTASSVEFPFEILVVSGGYATQNLNVSAEMEGLLAPAVQENELSLLQQLTSTITPDRYWTEPFSIPAAAAMNAPFGTRRSYNSGPVNTFHSGADFAAAPNTPIFAAAPGIVVLADTLNIRGNTVVLNHGWGVYTLYAHLTTINVQLGQSIPVGTVLGTAGSTGRVTGPHLHWEVWVQGTAVDPIQWTQWQIP